MDDIVASSLEFFTKDLLRIVRLYYTDPFEGMVFLVGSEGGDYSDYSKEIVKAYSSLDKAVFSFLEEFLSGYNNPHTYNSETKKWTFVPWVHSPCQWYITPVLLDASPQRMAHLYAKNEEYHYLQFLQLEWVYYRSPRNKNFMFDGKKLAKFYIDQGGDRTIVIRPFEFDLPAFYYEWLRDFKAADPDMFAYYASKNLSGEQSDEEEDKEEEV